MRIFPPILRRQRLLVIAIAALWWRAFKKLLPLSRKKWVQLGVLPVAGIAVAWGAASSVEQHGHSSSGYQQGAVAGADGDPATLIDGRSPGERGKGALLQTKLPRQRVAAAQHKRDDPLPPHQRVLSEIRFRPPGYAGSPNPLAFDGPLAAPVGMLDTALPHVPGLPQGLGYGSPFGPVGDGIARPASLALGSSPAAVPEPGSWMMMIVGIGAIGGMVRRRRRASAPEAMRPIP